MISSFPLAGLRIFGSGSVDWPAVLPVPLAGRSEGPVGPLFGYRDRILHMAGPSARTIFKPTDFQAEMIRQLKEDVRDPVAPWLGLAAPMQTGKSKLAGPIIRLVREEWGEDTRVIVLSSGRIITRQLMDDLTAQFGKISRFDGVVKDRPASLTVASVWSISNHLDRFPPGVRTVLINDEAFSTQSETIRTLYTHFGLGEIREEGGASFLRPCEGNGLVIGFSGTGGGLEGYHVSGHLDLLSAIETGLIRHLRGDRIVLDIPSEQRRIYGEGRMIWWEPTQENAEALAKIYRERIFPHYRKNLVYVPTIQHGRLLVSALSKEHGGKHPVYFVHSDTADMSDADFIEMVRSWEKGGGALISIGRLARGYRADGADAVFHTYQTDSPELFANRTGRAWGRAYLQDRSLVHPEPNDLYVLEATWNPRGSFANLARLLGLIDYPGTGIATRRLRSDRREQEEKETRRRLLWRGIECGEIDPIFSGIPLLESWRQTMGEILKRSGGAATLAASAGLSIETIAGFALGALPVCWRDVLALQRELGGVKATARLWIESWSGVVDEILGGRTKLTEDMETALFAWREEWKGADPFDLMTAVFSLNVILERHLSFLKAKVFHRRREIPVTEADRSLLRALLPEAADAREAAAWKFEGGISLAEMRLRLEQMILDDESWRRIWQGLAHYYRQGDREKREVLTNHFFQREGWEKDIGSAQGRLLYAVREGVALTHRGHLPMRQRLEGDERIRNSILQWIDGRLGSKSPNFSHRHFYDQIRSLLMHVGMNRSKAEAMVLAAAFEERGWSFHTRNAREWLQREMRIAATLRSGPMEISRVRMGSPLGYYREVARSLIRSGSKAAEIIPWVYEAVLEELNDPKIEKNEGSLMAVLTWLATRYPDYVPKEADLEEPFVDSESLEEAIDSGRLLREVERQFRELPKMERRILDLHFGLENEDEPRTLKEVGDLFNLSRERVRQLELRTLSRIRDRLIPYASEFVPPTPYSREYYERAPTMSDRITAGPLSTLPVYDPMRHLRLGSEDGRSVKEQTLARYVLDYYNKGESFKSLESPSSWRNQVIRNIFKVIRLALKYNAEDPAIRRKIVEGVVPRSHRWGAALVLNGLEDFYSSARQWRDSYSRDFWFLERE